MSCVKSFIGLLAAVLVVAATVGVPTVVQAGITAGGDYSPVPISAWDFKHDGLHCHVRHGHRIGD